jgi:hypothetical protein
MIGTPPAVDRAAARRSLAVEWLGGLLIAAGLGLVVALGRPDQFWLVLGVFTACFLAPSIALAWLVLGRGRAVQPDPRAEENVESRWLDKAAAGALMDLLPAAGIMAGAISLFRLDLAADVALIGVVVFALADGGLRFAVLRRRES